MAADMLNTFGRKEALRKISELIVGRQTSWGRARERKEVVIDGKATLYLPWFVSQKCLFESIFFMLWNLMFDIFPSAHVPGRLIMKDSMKDGAAVQSG